MSVDYTLGFGVAEGYQAFRANPTAPTIDDIIWALDHGQMLGQRAVQQGLSMLRHHPVEQFNFGTMKLGTVRDAQNDAILFVDHGHFLMPFNICMYRSNIVYDNCTVGYTVLCVDGRNETTVDAKYRNGVASVCLFRDNNGVMLAMHAINMMRTKRDAEGAQCVELQVTGDEIDYWGHRMGLKDGDELPDEMTEQITEGALLAMGQTMILNTKGVLKERVAPPAKPNAKRIKAGRPPLPYVTRVYTQVYEHAAAPGLGTHASPKPHLRRAHLRHYPARGIREAYSLPIEAQLINWDGQPLAPRKTYEVT